MNKISVRKNFLVMALLVLATVSFLCFGLKTDKANAATVDYDGVTYTLDYNDSIGRTLVSVVEVGGKTYFNFDKGYAVGTLNGTTLTVEDCVGNRRAANNDGALSLSFIDSTGTTVANEFLGSASGSDEVPDAYINAQFGSKAAMQTKVRADFAAVLASGFNPGCVQSVVKMWNGVLTQDYVLGDSGFYGWGSAPFGGRARLSTFVYNPNQKKFVFISDYVQHWDDNYRTSLGYPVMTQQETMTIGGTTYNKIQIYDNGYIHVNNGTVEAVLDVVYDAESNTFIKSIRPHRSEQYGAAVGSRIEVGDKLYQNFTRGYAYVTVAANGDFSDQVDVAGKNVELANGVIVESALSVNVMSAYVAQGVKEEVTPVWELAYRKGQVESEDTSVIQTAILAKYTALVESDYNVGISSDDIKIWNGMISQDFYDGDGEGLIGGGRIAMTVLGYSIYKNEVYVLNNSEIFACYNTNGGALGEMISDAFAFTLGTKAGTVQAFYNGYIFVDAEGNAEYATGVRYNETTKTFEEIVITDDDIKMASCTQAQIDASTYLGTRADLETPVVLTEVQDKILAKYKAMKEAGIDPGKPSQNGITLKSRCIWLTFTEGNGGNTVAVDNEAVTMVLVYNPRTAEVYAVYGVALARAYSVTQIKNGLVIPMSDRTAADATYFAEGAWYQEFEQSGTVKGVVLSTGNTLPTTAYSANKTYQTLYEEAKEKYEEENPNPDPDPNPNPDPDPNPPAKSGCSGSLTMGGALISVLALGATVVFSRKRK